MATNMYGGATVACRVCYRDQHGTPRELSCTPQKKWMNGYHLMFTLCQWKPDGGAGPMVPCSDEAGMSLVILLMAVVRLKSARALKMAPVLTEISNNIRGEILNFQMIKLHLK
ncbi:unnamed protein product [Urochloa humidicola]